MKLKIKAYGQVYTHEIESETVTIGRSSENDFVIPLEDFSRNHCRVLFKGEYAFIMDLGSKNGMMIDGKRAIPQQQYPIYQHTKVILANHFEFILPEGTSIREPDEDMELILDIPADKKNN